ncbi:MAG: hypothetical protein OXC18_04830 [Desulfurellaceae bacterium]|nr:hypothetical protein [Desulfurellaceae bacterium]
MNWRWRLQLMGGVLAVLGMLLTGCQTLQHAVSFTESQRDPQLARILGTRAELEEQYWQCRVEHGSADAAECAEYKRELGKPLALPAASE